MPRRRSTLLRPLTALATPGTFLFCKLSQLQESAKRRITERELRTLNHKIDKLLIKLDDSESEAAKSQDEECVVCITAKATMQTFPCGHCVVCRKCFIKTIQMAVNRRALPLRCVLCRDRVLKLKQTFHCSTEMRLPLSVSQYSVTSSMTSSPDWEELPSSSSLYSMSSDCSAISGASRTSKSSLRSTWSATSCKKKVTFAESPLLQDPLLPHVQNANSQSNNNSNNNNNTPPNSGLRVTTVQLSNTSRVASRGLSPAEIPARRTETRTTKVTSIVLTERRLPPIKESHREPSPQSSRRPVSPSPSSWSAPSRSAHRSAGVGAGPVSAVRRLVPLRRGGRRLYSTADDGDERASLLPRGGDGGGDGGVADTRI